MHNINEQLFLVISGYAGISATLDSFFLFVTTPLMFIIASIATVWAVMVRPLRAHDPEVRLRALRDAVFFVVSCLFVWAIVELIKGTVAFPRPHQYFYGVRTLLVYGDFDSFPSLHAAFSFALASIIYTQQKTLGILLFIGALLVSFSRVFVGVHFPIDVIVGAVIGGVVPWVLRSITARYI